MIPAVMRLIGCNVYVSEGRNLQLIRRLEAACLQHPRAVVLSHTFIDEPYNRTGFSLAANSIPELAATVHAVAQQALQHIDLTTHAAQHPRLGVLDHVSLHPLGPQATLSLAAQAATAIGQQLSQPPLQLPVYYYGAAHPEYRRLAEIRRRLGYFKPSSSSHPAGGKTGIVASNSSTSESWCGSISQLQLSEFPPDAGPHTATAAAGVVTVGAVPWVTNFNVPLYTEDMPAAKAIARAVSTKGGGLPGVEAMALPHGPGVIEVATNLIAYDWRKAAGASASSSASSSSSNSSSSSSNHHLQTQTAGLVGDSAPSSAPSSSSDSRQHLAPTSQAQHSDGSASGQGQQHHDRGALAGAGPAEVAAAVAREAQRLGLQAPGPGYITNKTPPELIAIAAEKMQQS